MNKINTCPILVDNKVTFTVNFWANNNITSKKPQV